MSFFCTLTTTNGTEVIGTQYASLELFNVGNPPPTNLADALVICHASNPSFDIVNGAFSYSSDVNTLQTLFDTYFALDAAIFEQIIGGTLVAFALGLMTGGIVKMLQKT